MEASINLLARDHTMKASGSLPSPSISCAAEPTHTKAGTQPTLDPAARFCRAPATPIMARDDLAPRIKLKDICGQSTEASPQHLGGFLGSAHRYLTQRWVNDRSAAADHVGTKLYSDMRRAELQAIEGAGYIAEQYGLSVTKILTQMEYQAGLRITHEHSASYRRSYFLEGLFSKCMNIYSAAGHSHPPEKIQFANCVGVANKLRNILFLGGIDSTTDEKSESIVDIKRLAHGLVAIEFKNTDDVERGGKLLEILGGLASLHELMKQAHPVPRLQTTPNPRIDNAATLAGLLRADGQDPVAALARLPQGHAMQPAAACAASLLAGLGKTLERQAAAPKFKHDPLIANALHALADVTHALPTLTGDSPRFFAGYAAMLEELNILLAAAKPYGNDDFKAAALTMLKARAGKVLDHLHIYPPQTFLCSSGMGALLCGGLDAARTLNGSAQFRGLTDQVNQPLYFEVFKLLRYDEKAMAGQEVLMASLNASLPGREGVSDETNNWDAQKLLRTMQEWFATHEVHTDRPAVLILDTTIETPGPDGTSDLAAVLAGLKDPVNNGLLKILLCKSHQKYTMGSGKIMAGTITMIARNDAKTEEAARQLRVAEEDLDWMQNDESQMLTHFLTHAHASELPIIENAAKNAAFIDEMCLRTRPDAANRSRTRREGATPFIATDFRGVEVKAANGVDVRRVPVIDLATPQFMQRFGFGFLPTIGFALDEPQWRITAGQETQAELTEQFYGLGWLNEADTGTLTAAAVLSQADRIAAEAAQAIYDAVDVGAWAEAALHVLRCRPKQGNDQHAAALSECEALLDKINIANAAGADGREMPQLKAELRDKLKAELMTLEAPAESRLAGQLKIIGASFAPRLPDAIRAGTDVALMRAAIERAPGHFSKGDAADPPIDSLRVSLAPNKVASLLKLLGAAFGPQNASNADRPALEAVYQGALAAGLPRVSASTRSHLVLDWSRLQVQKLARAVGKDAGRTAVEGLFKHVHLVPYREDKAKILASIPENAFTALDPSLQRKLVAVLFDPLDACSRVEFIRTLSESGNPAKADACLARLKADEKGSMDGGSRG